MSDDRNMRRKASLRGFELALWEAMEKMPRGYEDATDDRNRFVTPIEQVIADLQEEMKR